MAAAASGAGGGGMTPTAAASADDVSDFYYFGYGSNMSVVSLRAKGVTPVESECAVLRGWRIVFDLPQPWKIEGAAANVRAEAGAACHGVLHRCAGGSLAALDRIEARGVAYDRFEMDVVTYGGVTRTTNVYVGLADSVRAGCLPSRRYLDILVNGAVEQAIEPSYVEMLRAHAVHTYAPFPPFVGGTDWDGVRVVGDADAAPTFTRADVAASANLSSVAGHVFDMSRSRDGVARILRKIFGGKDVTFFLVQRMSTSDGSEVEADIVAGRLTDEQRAYLNDYLWEYDSECAYRGVLLSSQETDA